MFLQLLFYFLYKKKVARASLYFALPLFIGLRAVQRINKQRKGANQQISYAIKIIKTVWRSQTIDIALSRIQSLLF